MSKVSQATKGLGCTVWALAAILVALAVLAFTPLQAPDQAAAVMRRYWTAAPNGPQDAPMDSLVCVYGRIIVDTLANGRVESGPSLDSARVFHVCPRAAMGAIGYVKGVQEPDSVAGPYFVPRLCAALRAHPELQMVGLIHGIEDGTRRVQIFACWRTE